LQQEVQELRGQLEVQAHDLKLLQQQQVAFYKDLDARLSGVNSAKVTSSKPSMDLAVGSNEPASKASISEARGTKTTAPALAPTPEPSFSTSRANPADEQISYLAAYELVKNKRYDDALSAMNVFVQKYPRGGYTANAQYWLGELYLVKKDYEKSIEHFNVVLQQFPTSSKSAASMLKTGYAYAEQGNKQEAKKFLQQVVRAYPDTPTAQLANSKLRTI
ncbi:MAG: tol-pal system protein YbgF, partial [Legionella longbeachae]|nr:tol-pal system protein YbgF [Legionella longbeachae]